MVDPTYIGRTGERWPNERGPWELTFHWADVDGRAVCVGLELLSVKLEREGTTTQIDRPVNRKAGAQSVTASVIREIPWTSTIEDSRATLKGLARYLADDPELAQLAEERRSALEADLPERGYGRAHYAKVAGVYLAADKAGDRAPTRAVSDSFDVPHSTAAKWVRRARELELLPAVREER